MSLAPLILVIYDCREAQRLSSMAPRSVRFGVRSRKISELPRASAGPLRRWSRPHLQSLAATNPHWARVVGYSPFSLSVLLMCNP
jgi:hypothetical protein